MIGSSSTLVCSPGVLVLVLLELVLVECGDSE